METRKNFLKKTGITAIGLSLLNDPFIKALANIEGISFLKAANQFSFTCEILRPEDLLHLRYYCVNLKANVAGTHLERINSAEDAYILVRLPQQHVAEEVHSAIGGSDWLVTPTKVNIPKNQKQVFSQSFISGYSYLTFKLNKEQNKIHLTARELLRWDQFKLITLDDLKTYPSNIPVKVEINGNYPLSAGNMPPSICIDTVDKVSIPVTVFEAPYKMILSPIAVYKGAKSPAHLFARNNQENIYWPNKHWPPCSKVVPRLSELWSNDLIFQMMGSNHAIQKFAPNFKVIAYEEITKKQLGTIHPPDYDCNIRLLPDPYNNDRSNLAYLTNMQDANRNVVSDYFNVSSLGVSTFLQYSNENEGKYQLTGWKQDVTLGRDSYVETAEKAIDLRTTLKLIVLNISERRVEQGCSFLIYRQYFKYVDAFKSFTDANPLVFQGHLIKSIKPKKVGSFFSVLQRIPLTKQSASSTPAFFRAKRVIILHQRK